MLNYKAIWNMMNTFFSDLYQPMDADEVLKRAQEIYDMAQMQGIIK